MNPAKVLERTFCLERKQNRKMFMYSAAGLIRNMIKSKMDFFYFFFALFKGTECEETQTLIYELDLGKKKRGVDPSFKHLAFMVASFH